LPPIPELTPRALCCRAIRALFEVLMTEKTRILIADDHPIFRSGLRQIIEADGSMSVIAEADDGAAALKLIREHQPDVIVLDLNMPGLSGFEVVSSMRDERLSGEVVLLTMHNEEAMFTKAVNLGVRGYVLKDSAGSDILNCLQAVRKGQNYSSAELTQYLFKKAAGQTTAVAGLDSLTPTERRVLALIAQYLTSRDIADQLGISLRTVENHRNNICAKLDVHGSHALIKFALKHQTEL
jgi:DNA-binding NarL/FixJ family response regulator